MYNLKRSAAEAHRLLVETYGEAALSERSCRDWFQKFKKGEFDIENEKLSGRPKVYEDVELETLLNQDSRQTQQEQYDGQYFESNTWYNKNFQIQMFVFEFLKRIHYSVV